MIFETRCAGCDKAGAPICTTCRFALVGPTPREQHHGVIAAVPFTGRARQVVLGLKYRNRRSVGRHLAGLIVNRVVEQGAHHGVDVVTWAPTSAKRRRERGFDQGELLARVVARQLGVPCRRLLERDGSATQTGRTRTQRRDEAPRFVARPGIDGRCVLVVDDVVTTGSTLMSAASALVDRGAIARLAAVASTPDTRSGVVVPFRRTASSAA